MAWHMEISRREMKKNPKLGDFHKWITRETEAGHISRQEAVSMIPVFFMDIEPHHKVLDMCAAPGMKTTQLLENLTVGDTTWSTKPTVSTHTPSFPGTDRHRSQNEKSSLRYDERFSLFDAKRG